MFNKKEIDWGYTQQMENSLQLLLIDRCFVQSTSKRLPLAGGGSKCRDPQPGTKTREMTREP